ncbi:LexA family transcriptional regulator [Consotaella salsifontis]|uniref:Helix-turn-helix n=1 Tax=Consotaella salsifontis TaxID=1365950 RepID=A0A1T4RW65_9HYPH|nr:XRE family transcriptional regulator [Consotaella salsifontis]SKA20220.1 Helix-turn-helix [Consotaella salsifontis]
MTTRLAAMLRDRMNEMGLSQTELAARIGSAQQAISALLNGDVAAPRKWRDIARILQIPEEQMRALMIEAARDTDKNTRIPKSLKSREFLQVVPTPPLGGNVVPYRDDRRDLAKAEKSRNMARRLKTTPLTEWGRVQLPVLGQAVAGSDGRYIFNGDIVDWVPMPPQLDGVKGAYGVYVDGESMTPRYMPGELVHVHPNRPPRRGDDVVVQVACDDMEHGGAPWGFIKRFEGFSGSKLVLFQYNPAMTLEFDRDDVVSVHTIVGRM